MKASLLTKTLYKGKVNDRNLNKRIAVEIVKPTTVMRPFGGRITVKMFGKKTGDWQTTGIHNNTGECCCTDTYKRLDAIQEEIGATAVWLPRPTVFNAKIAYYCEFTRLHCTHHRNHTLTMWYALPAEGLELIETPGQNAAFFSTADCAVVTLHSTTTGKTIVFHAGRDSLIDRQRILTGYKSRVHESVVNAALSCFADEDPFSLQAHICGAAKFHMLSSDNTAHAYYLTSLKKFLLGVCPHAIRIHNDTLSLSLEKLIMHQLTKNGMRELSISTNCCSVDVDLYADNEYVWWSHQRWFRCGKQGPDGRNGILVIRHW